MDRDFKKFEKQIDRFFNWVMLLGSITVAIFGLCFLVAVYLVLKNWG